LRGGGQAKSGEALGRGADPGGDRLVETQAQTLRAGLGDLQTHRAAGHQLGIAVGHQFAAAVEGDEETPGGEGLQHPHIEALTRLQGGRSRCCRYAVGRDGRAGVRRRGRADR